jgi:hypothetical protein
MNMVAGKMPRRYLKMVARLMKFEHRLSSAL